MGGDSTALIFQPRRDSTPRSCMHHMVSITTHTCKKKRKYILMNQDVFHFSYKKASVLPAYA